MYQKEKSNSQIYCIFASFLSTPLSSNPWQIYDLITKSRWCSGAIYQATWVASLAYLHFNRIKQRVINTQHICHKMSSITHSFQRTNCIYFAVLLSQLYHSFYNRYSGKSYATVFAWHDFLRGPVNCFYM